VINRPETRNAISFSVMSDLEHVLDEIDHDPPLVVAIRGSGDRAFVSGGDLKEFAAIRDHATASAMANRMRTILDRLASLPPVTIAELNGHALGGGAEFAVAADIRIAADDVTIGFGQIRLGIMPAWGGIERLVALVGRARATYLLTTGQPIGAAQAVAWGLIEEIVPRREFDKRCAALEAEVGARPAAAVTSIINVVSAVQSPLHPTTASMAVDSFARTWVSDEHWAALARASRPSDALPNTAVADDRAPVDVQPDTDALPGVQRVEESA
jgi:enoyl-CoA hydratase/carnithine racemase